MPNELREKIYTRFGKPNTYETLSTSELRVRLARRETGLSPPVNNFTDRSKAVLLLWIIYIISVLFLL